MIIRTLPYNYIIKGKQTLEFNNKSIGAASIEKIILDEIDRIQAAPGVDLESLKQKIFGVQLRFGPFEFEYLKASSELLRMLKNANSITLTYAYFYNKLTLYSREIHYTYDKFPVMSFFNMENKSRIYYDSKYFVYKEDFYKSKPIIFKPGHIVRNVLDNREYFICKDPSQYSVFESLVSVDPNSENKYCISSYGALVLEEDKIYSNIMEYLNKKSLEKLKEKENDDS